MENVAAIGLKVTSAFAGFDAIAKVEIESKFKSFCRPLKVFGVPEVVGIKKCDELDIGCDSIETLVPRSAGSSVWALDDKNL